MREYANQRGFEIEGEYIDTASGTTQDRSSYKAMLVVARKRKTDVVLVWRYDRFARSTQALVNALKEFQSVGVDFISGFSLQTDTVGEFIQRSLSEG